MTFRLNPANRQGSPAPEGGAPLAVRLDALKLTRPEADAAVRPDLMPRDHLDLSAKLHQHAEKLLTTKLPLETDLPESQPEPEAKSEEKIDSAEVQSDPEAKSEAKSETKSETQSDPEARTGTQPEVKPESEVKPELKPESETGGIRVRETPIKPTIRKTPAMLLQEEAIGRALAGEAAAFKSLAGQDIDVRLAPASAPKGAPEGKQWFTLTVAADSFAVSLAGDLDPKEQMARVVEFFALVPAHLRPVLKTLALEPAANPGDAEWAKIFGLPTFSSAATAGSGKITIWNLTEHPYNLNEGVFNHEMAHLIGDAYTDSRVRHAEMIPAGWEAAMTADGKRVSAYAEHNPNEDFAESWRYFLQARPHAELLKTFQQTYPERVKILEAIYEATFEGKFDAGARP